MLFVKSFFIQDTINNYVYNVGSVSYGDIDIHTVVDAVCPAMWVNLE